MSLITDASVNLSIFIVDQQMPTIIVSLHHMTSVDQVTLLDRTVLQVYLTTKSLHLRE